VDTFQKRYVKQRHIRNGVLGVDIEGVSFKSIQKRQVKFVTNEIIFQQWKETSSHWKVSKTSSPSEPHFSHFKAFVEVVYRLQDARIENIEINNL
jgi:hypothetical protein